MASKNDLSCVNRVAVARCVMCGPTGRMLLWIFALAALMAADHARALEGALVLTDVRIDSSVVTDLTNGDQFGAGATSVGDLDGNGVPDLAVGARGEDGLQGDTGAVYVLFLDSDGSVLSQTKFDSTPANDPNGVFGGVPTALLGISLAWLGDYDGDGFGELAVGEPLRDSPDVDSGKIWIIDIDSSGLPLSGYAIAEFGSIPIPLDAGDRFGFSLANVGDWNGDGAPELAVGAVYDGDGGSQNGAVYVLYLDPNPLATEILSYAKISDTEGGFGGDFDSPTWFGASVAGIGDVDSDGQLDMAVGAQKRSTNGAVWVLLMDPGCQTLTVTPPNSNCVVKSAPSGFVEIRAGMGGFTGSTNAGKEFGSAVDWLPDGSGFAPDRLVVGEHLDNAVWLLTLASDGNVASESRIGDGENTQAAISGAFGYEVASLGDLNGDQITDLVVGARLNDTGGTDRGAAYLLTLSSCPTIVTEPIVFHAPNDDGVNPCQPLQLAASSSEVLHLYLETGPDVSANPLEICVDDLGDGDELCAWDVRLELDGDLAITSFAVDPGLIGANTNGPPYPSQELRINWLDPGTPMSGVVKLGDLTVSLAGSEGAARVANGSVAVGAALELHSMPPNVIALPEPSGVAPLVAGVIALVGLAHRRRVRRAAGLVLLAAILAPGLGTAPARAATSIKGQAIITGPFNTGVYNEHMIALEPIGDVDGDGTVDVAVGLRREFALDRLWILFLDEDAQVLGYEIISSGGAVKDYFGRDLQALGDLNADGVPDLAVGASQEPSNLEGYVTILYLDRDGSENGRRTIGAGGQGGFGGSLDVQDAFGRGVAYADLDGDGRGELIVGAGGDDDVAAEAGAVWVLFLDDDEIVTSEIKFTAGQGGFGGSLATGDYFGSSVAVVGDLDGNGTPDLAVGARGDDDHPTAPPPNSAGAVWILYLDGAGVGNVSVIGQHKISMTQGGFTFGVENSGSALASRMEFLGDVTGEGGGVLAISGERIDGSQGDEGVYLLDIPPDFASTGLVRDGYAISDSTRSSLGATDVCGTDIGFNESIAAMPDMNGDETLDLMIGNFNGSPCGHWSGQGYLFYMQDSDHDGLDDKLDNCVSVHNPAQTDSDGDGIGDLCDNCVDVSNPAHAMATDCNGDLDTTDPGEGVGEQCDVDDDGEGDACEPVEIQLVTTGTPGAPSWDLLLQCGALDVTIANAAVVLPAGITGVQTLTLNGANVGSSSTSGPGLSSPQRSDAIYFSVGGNLAPPDNRLCNALDPPTLLGSLTSTGGIAGTQLAAAALTAEGVGTPGFGLNLAEEVGGAIPLPAIRLVNGVPLPILDLELGPAVIGGTCDGGSNGGGSCTLGGECPGGTCETGTRWEVLLKNATTEFHRVAFGLIVPFGTTTSDMRWVGCESTSTPSGARALVAGERSCTGGTGFGVTASANDSWTVGPQASAPGTQLDHTLYVVLEGNRDSETDLFTLNPANVGPVVVLGTVELDGTPDLEPALTTDGVNDIDDLFDTGNSVAPFKESDDFVPLPDVTQVKLVGAFNPADDVDADGIQDLADNCPFRFNPVQSNRGSFLDATDGSDFLGDACQCSESTDDGAVLDPDDLDEIRDFLSGKITNPVIAAEIEERCSIVGSTECNIRDLVFLALAMDAGDPSVETRCDAALSPAAGP